MTQEQRDTEQINDYIESMFSSIKTHISDGQMEQRKAPQILLFLVREDVEGPEVYGSSFTHINGGSSSELLKKEQETMKTIVEIDDAKILCGCSVTYSENELRMKFIDYVNKDVKYRVHNFDLVSDGVVLNWLYYTNNKTKQYGRNNKSNSKTTTTLFWYLFCSPFCLYDYQTFSRLL